MRQDWLEPKLDYGWTGRRMVAGIMAAVLTGAPCFGSSGQQDSPKEQAAALAKKAKRAAKGDRAADAYLYYSEASALQPKNGKLRQQMDALQSRAAVESHPAPPAGEEEDEADDASADAPPEEIFDSLTAEDYAHSRQLLPPPELNPRPGRQDFDIRGDARTLFDRVAQRFGLQAVYDGDYPPTGPSIRFRIPGVDYRDALHDLEAMTNSFVVPVSPTLFLVAQDNPQKRNDLEQTIVVQVPVPDSMTQQELTEIGQAVKQATNVDKIAMDTAQDQIVIRDRVSRALPAQALLQQLMAPRAQVMMEVEFLEVTDSDILNYGFNITNQFSAIYLGNILNYVPTIPQGITALATFGGGKTLIGLTVAQAQAMFNESVSNARSLYRTSVRSVAGQAATFHVGEKYPVITQQFAGAVTPGTTGTIYAPPPSFTYEDLGTQVKVTPHVHGDEAVSLTVEISFELLAGSSVNGIPVIGRREMKSEVRLAEGEWAVVAGLITKSVARSRSGFLGLERIPLLGYLFQQNSKDTEKDNVLVAIRPHVVTLPPDASVTHAVRVGSANRPFTPL